jgi:RNA-binding protein Musashi
MTESLHDYFSQFGEVQECTVMRDSATGRSRGFGFLTFKDPKTVNTVMVKEHFLDGKIVSLSHIGESQERKMAPASISRRRGHSHLPKNKGLLRDAQIDPKRAIPRDEQEKTAKIFVGGVSQDATEEDFEGFFAQFGRVIDATLMMDKDTGRPRGFGFVTFDNDAAVEKCLQFYPLEILGKPIEVKRAQPRGKIGEDEDFGRGRGRGKFGRDERFGSNDNNQAAQNAPSQNQNMMGGNTGMTPQMMAQYWQRMQQYFSMMQQQMAANMMGGMGGMGMNPQQMQMMQMMQQQQKMQGGNSPNGPNANMANMQGMNPQMMQQMMNMQQNGMNGMNMGGGNRPPSGPANMGGGQRQFSPQEQMAFEQQKYEQQHARRQGHFPQGPRGGGFQGQQGQQQGGGPQSWEGMYDDVPQPEGNGGGKGGAGPVRHNTPKLPKGPSGNPAPSAPANAPTGPKNPGNKPGGFRGGRGRFHPYGR